MSSNTRLGFRGGGSDRPEDARNFGSAEGENTPLSPAPSDCKVFLGGDVGSGSGGGKGGSTYGTYSSTGATRSIHEQEEEEGEAGKKGGCGCCGRQCIRDSREGWVLGVGALLGCVVAAIAILVGVFFSGLSEGTTSKTEPPPAVTGAAIASVSPSSAKITFDKVESGSASTAPVTRYEAQQQEQDTGAAAAAEAVWKNVSLPNLGLSGSFTAEDLLGDTRYCWRVAAINVAGPGPWSSPACGQTAQATAPPRPPAPRQTFSVPSDSAERGAVPSTGELVVTWDAVVETGGSPITRCEFELCAEEKGER